MDEKKMQLFDFNCLIYFLIRASFIGIMTSNLLFIVKQDSWLSMILGIILGFIPLIIYYFIMNIDPNENIIGIINKTLGKYLGYSVNIILIIFIFIFSSIMFWSLVDFVSSQYLYKTPDLIISIILGIGFFYMISNGVLVIGRTSVILIYISIVLLLFTMLGLFYQSSISNLQPVLEFGLNPIMKGSLQFIVYSVLPLFLLGIIPKKNISNNKKMVRRGIYFYLFSALTIVIMMFLLLSIYGIEVALLIQNPEFHLFKKISLSGVVERFENFLAIIWLFDLFVFIALGMYFVKKGIMQLFNFKWNKFLSIILVIGTIISSIYLLRSTIERTMFLINVFPFLIFSVLFGIPVLILIINGLKKAL